MKTLNIIATKSSPEINFNAQSHVLSISGESYPENTVKFYQPVFVWLDDYLRSLSDQPLTLNIELIYFNSSSSKVLMDIFDLLERSSNKGKTIIVNWIYDEDNDAALEYGEEFAEDSESVTFNLVQK